MFRCASENSRVLVHTKSGAPRVRGRQAIESVGRSVRLFTIYKTTSVVNFRLATFETSPKNRSFRFKCEFRVAVKAEMPGTGKLRSGNCQKVYIAPFTSQSELFCKW